MISIILAFIGFVALGLSTGMLGVAWPSIQETFNLPLSAAGILLLAVTGGGVFAGSVSGRLIVRLETGWLLVLSSLCLGLGLLGQALAPSWVLMIGIAVLAGIGNGLIDSGLNIYIAQHHSGRVMNWLHACFGLGATLGPLLMTAVLDRELSWRLGYGVAAAIQAVMMLGFLLTVKKWRSITVETETVETTTVTKGNGRILLMWMSITLFFLYAGVEVTAGQWSFPFYTETRGVDLAVAGYWVSIYWGSLTIGRLLFGFVVNSMGAITTLRACMIGIIIGTIGFMMPVTGLSFAGLALIGFAQAPIFPLLVSETPKRLGPSLATRAIGYQVAAAGFGIAILPGLAGVIADNWGLQQIGPFMLIASLAMLGLHEWILLRASTQRQTEVPVA
ncbi:MAG: MFS transporter [Ardenticatenaceae bacterium]|nr:MFS transporter [Ardenticatenaceae bacterium]